MLQVQEIRTNKTAILEALKKRGGDYSINIEKALALDSRRKAIQTDLENLQAESNKISRTVGELFKSGQKEYASKIRARSSEIKMQTKQLSSDLEDCKIQLQEYLYKIPNVPNEKVPFGTSEEDNKEIYRGGKTPNSPSESNPHWELAKRYNLIDFDLGNKVTGSGFPIYIGKGAKLQRALVSFFLDRNTEAGYTEYQPPLLVNEASGYGTGQLPDKEGQMYYVGEDNLYLIPTSEVPITNIFRACILKKEDLPIKCTAFTPCFRREAGSYGAHVRGLNRLHQFDKVEIVRVEHPKKSHQALDEMVSQVKSLLEQLELKYRILLLCGSDLGFTSALTYDFEVFSATQKKWLEVSSVSNFETFQANRLKLRFRESDGKTYLAHTLNGSALALPRIVAALLENHQTKEGIKIPKALVPYTGFEWIY
ncbi:serine--tRNA ligase [Elysia marginata]|uniref:Serine--tRNA ligase n=1 Tax=Elysia marginata TaxID=1093978 RepID=A0AAV4K1Z8_9GAST|nr:serine--tRNA ligase [Elysia marginata]